MGTIQNGRTGLLVAPGDVGALASPLLALLRDAPRRETIGQAAREAVERDFSWKQAIEATLEVIADHRARIGWHLVARSTYQSVHRLADDLPSQVPQSEVDGGEHPVGQRTQVQPLALLESIPDPLAIKRVLANQHRGDDLGYRPFIHSAKAPTGSAIVSRDGQPKDELTAKAR